MIADWLIEPFQYSFMVRAFVGTSLIALLSAMIGVFIVLKGLAFIGDAIAHTSFSGIAIALLLGWNLYFGALLLAMLTAVGITFLHRTAKIKHDTALAILFTGAFAVGVIVMARMPSFAGDLSALLLGTVLGIRSYELWWIIAAVMLIGIVLLITFEHLVFVSFDPIGAEAAGLPVFWLQLLLMLMLSVAVVVAIQTVGVILVMALLITPAATANIFTKKLLHLMGLAALFGLIATWVGLYISFYYSAPPGASIVLAATLQFGLALGINTLKNRITLAKQRIAAR